MRLRSEGESSHNSSPRSCGARRVKCQPGHLDHPKRRQKCALSVVQVFSRSFLSRNDLLAWLSLSYLDLSLCLESNVSLPRHHLQRPGAQK